MKIVNSALDISFIVVIVFVIHLILSDSLLFYSYRRCVSLFEILFIFVVLDIPHFKEVVVMSLSCEWCGHKTNEIKSGSGINDRGVKIALHVTDPTDLSRDILKVRLSIPLGKILHFFLAKSVYIFINSHSFIQ